MWFSGTMIYTVVKYMLKQCLYVTGRENFWYTLRYAAYIKTMMH